MWRNSLVDITRRAGKKATLPRLQKSTKTITVDKRALPSSTFDKAVTTFSPESDVLYGTHTDLQSQIKISILQSSLENGQPHLRAAEDGDALLRQAQRLPFLYAQQAFCVLMRAGEVQLALQLVSFWQSKKPPNLKVSRRRVKKELEDAIDDLEKLKDFTTLKSFINILSDALKEQTFAQKELFRTVALTHSRELLSNAQYRLFAPLGIDATSDVLQHAILAVYGLGKESGVSAFEKILLADQCASSTISETVPGGSPHLPYSLLRQIEALQAAENIDGSFIHQVCPELTSKLVHPSHYRIIDILSLSADAARYIEKHWKTQGVLSPSSTTIEAIPTAWCRLTHRVLPDSPSLQSVREKQLLISLLAQTGHIADLMHDQTWSNLRAQLIKLLKHAHQSVRRFTAAALLKNRHVATNLKISPAEIGVVYAQSFYSKGKVDPALCAFCNFAVRRLCRNERYREAARLAWNHLSVDCPATQYLFRSSSAALDFAVLSMSRAMRSAAAEGRAKSWMGHRSLALLHLAASYGNNVTVLHCVPVCVNAMDCCGVSFATVSEFLSNVFSTDNSQKKWAMNMIRLCSANETVPMQISEPRRCVASDFFKFLMDICDSSKSRRGPSIIRSPTRSKQLALWETVHSQEANHCLNGLMIASFLSEAARKEILNCSFLLNSPTSTVKSSGTDNAKLTAEDVWNWEIAASIASNCTSTKNYQMFLKALRCRKAALGFSSSNDFDGLSAVMLSELEGHDSLFLKALVDRK
jgi:hypothetical protein